MTLERTPSGILKGRCGARASVGGLCRLRTRGLEGASCSSEGEYSIGEIAARTGLTPDALRYYERLGLLPRFRRTAGGFRIYPSDVVERVRFIKQAQTIGLSLDEIRALVRHLDRDGPEHRSEVMDLVTTKLAQVDATLRELREFQRTLKGYLERPAVAPLEHQAWRD